MLPRILCLLDELEIRATFAVVGHLLAKPGEAPRPQFLDTQSDWGVEEWYDSIEEQYNICPECLFWPDLPDLFGQASVSHEIALHTFSHRYIDAPHTSEQLVRFEVEANREILREAGLTPSNSIVFPGNRPGHLGTLASLGIRCYRGLDANWFSPLPKWVSGLGHVADCALALSPPVYKRPQLTRGIANIPGSYLFWGTAGFRRYIPISCRLRQIRKGLQKAVRDRAIFHLWMHPINLADHPELMLNALHRALRDVSELRDQSGLQVVTMSNMTEE